MLGWQSILELGTQSLFGEGVIDANFQISKSPLLTLGVAVAVAPFYAHGQKETQARTHSEAQSSAQRSAQQNPTTTKQSIKVKCEGNCMYNYLLSSNLIRSADSQQQQERAREETTASL